MSRPLRADAVRSGDISKIGFLLALVLAICVLAWWAFIGPYYATRKHPQANLSEPSHAPLQSAPAVSKTSDLPRA